MRDLYLLGGGGHALVVAEVALASSVNYRLAGYVDPSKNPETARALGITRLDDDLALTEYATALAVLAFGGVGSAGKRRRAVERVSSLIAGWGTLIHPNAVVSPSATIGVGTVVMAGAIIQTGARIGAHCVINSGAIVEHEVQVGDYVEVSPSAAIGGGTKIGTDAYVGMGATVRDHVTIGANAIVAMGAVVVGDIAPGLVVRGVPAR
jgi:acetyltransferase EpsM